LREILAMTGAPPVPVPPPSPAGHENHVGALEHLFDLVPVILRGLPPDLRLGAGAQSPGELAADIELDIGVAHQQGLGVGVHRNELDALQSDLDHAVHGVDTAAADTDDLDDGEVVVRWGHVASCFRYGDRRSWTGRARPADRLRLTR
jgi:hypothetical protein